MLFNQLKLAIIIACSYLSIIESSVLSQEVVRGSAAFIIDGSGHVSAASISAAVGQGDAYSRSFYDPLTGNLSSLAIGSFNTIQCDGSPCNAAGSLVVEIESSSGTQPVNNDLVPNVITTAP
ncbi:MAG: hypothetical protein VKJ02_10785 [Snowella sp.]|nr:hypothetical protein [Snowella sp.]